MGRNGTVRKYKIPFRELYFVWWVDAYCTMEETVELSSDRDHETISIGVKVKEDDEYIYLSHFYDGISNSMADPYTAIPHGMVKHILIVETNEQA